VGDGEGAVWVKVLNFLFVAMIRSERSRLLLDFDF
jgi:hypothetical protein